MQHGGQVQVNSSAESQENNGSINYVLVLFLHTCPRVETTFAVCKWLCCSLFVKSIYVGMVLFPFVCRYFPAKIGLSGIHTILYSIIIV